jgi:ribosomal protein S18 acetylase RimI-like enzyme
MKDPGKLELEFQAQPDPADARAVGEGLHGVLSAQLGSRRREPFAFILRNGEGSVGGGLVGKLLFDDLHVDQLWLDESFRGMGYGRELMERAEAHATAEGCYRVFLNTMSTEVLGFYERLGYFEIGRVEDFPVGHTVFFLRKDLES